MIGLFQVICQEDGFGMRAVTHKQRRHRPSRQGRHHTGSFTSGRRGAHATAFGHGMTRSLPLAHKHGIGHRPGRYSLPAVHQGRTLSNSNTGHSNELPGPHNLARSDQQQATSETACSIFLRGIKKAAGAALITLAGCGGFLLTIALSPFLGVYIAGKAMSNGNCFAGAPGKGCAAVVGITLLPPAVVATVSVIACSPVFGMDFAFRTGRLLYGKKDFKAPDVLVWSHAFVNKLWNGCEGRQNCTGNHAGSHAGNHAGKRAGKHAGSHVRNHTGKRIRKPEPYVDNQQDWSKTLWTIYRQRRMTSPGPVDELRKHHKKITCWSWQWFPAGFAPKTSPRRQACAFKNEADLMTYYRSRTLFGEFLELARLAVRCPMGNDTDECVLAKSLLLCVYAARRCHHPENEATLSDLITQQQQKHPATFQRACRETERWIKKNCSPLAG